MAQICALTLTRSQQIPKLPIQLRKRQIHKLIHKNTSKCTSLRLRITSGDAKSLSNRDFTLAMSGYIYEEKKKERNNSR